MTSFFPHAQGRVALFSVKAALLGAVLLAGAGCAVVEPVPPPPPGVAYAAPCCTVYDQYPPYYTSTYYTPGVWWSVGQHGHHSRFGFHH